MSKKEKADLERIIFFQGSFFYAARPVPGLEKLPLTLLENFEGDSFTVQRSWHYSAPKELASPVPCGPGELVLDNRCQDCVKAFPDVRGLLQHCQETGHNPIMAGSADSGVCASEPPVFISFVNMVLSRALGERLAKWGREYIDPSQVRPSNLMIVLLLQFYFLIHLEISVNSG